MRNSDFVPAMLEETAVAPGSCWGSTAKSLPSVSQSGHPRCTEFVVILSRTELDRNEITFVRLGVVSRHITTQIQGNCPSCVTSV